MAVFPCLFVDGSAWTTTGSSDWLLLGESRPVAPLPQPPHPSSDEWRTALYRKRAGAPGASSVAHRVKFTKKPAYEAGIYALNDFT